MISDDFLWENIDLSTTGLYNLPSCAFDSVYLTANTFQKIVKTGMIT